jgi:hypothetical protein
MKQINILVFLFLMAPVLPCLSQEARLYKADVPFYTRQFRSVPTPELPNMITVDYQFHHGKATLSDGRKLTGWFSFKSYKMRPDLEKKMKLKQPEKVEYKTEVNGEVIETIPFDEIKRLALVGKDSMILSDGDSTVFLQKGKMLLRVLTEKPMPLYDNLYMVDELENNNFTFWRALKTVTYTKMGIGPSQPSIRYTYKPAKTVLEWVDASAYTQLRTTGEIYYDWQGKVKQVEKWEDVPAQIPVDPFIKNVADVLYKFQPADISYAIIFSLYDRKKELVPFFEPIVISLKDGNTLNGLGFIVPFRYDQYGKTGYITFYDGKDFTLIDGQKVNYAKYRNKTYTPLFNKKFDNWFMTYPMVFKGEKYQVADGYAFPETIGYFNESGRPFFHVFRLNGKDKYVHETNEKVYDELVERAR